MKAIFSQRIQRFENQFLDEGGDVAIADDAELISLLRTGACTAGAGDVDQESTVALLDGISGQAAADRQRARASHRSG